MGAYRHVIALLLAGSLARVSNAQPAPVCFSKAGTYGPLTVTGGGGNCIYIGDGGVPPPGLFGISDWTVVANDVCELTISPAQPKANVKVRLGAIETTESVFFFVNGALYPVQPSDLDNATTPPTPAGTLTANGLVVTKDVNPGTGTGNGIVGFGNAVDSTIQTLMVGQYGLGRSTAFDICVTPQLPPPTISKAFGASTIPLNGSTSLTFTISNSNAAALTGVAFSDTLPAGLVVSTPNGLSTTCGGSTTATAGTGSVSLSGGSITASSNCTISVNVTGTIAGTKDNTTDAVSATESGTGATSNTATITVVAPPTIGKAFGASSVPLNGSTSLTFTITNPNATALTGVAFSDTLPGGLVVSTPNGLSAFCGGSTTATAGSGSVSLSGGSIAASSNCTISVNVTGTTVGTKDNTTGAVSSTNGGTGVTSKTATLYVVAPPVISKAFGSGPLVAGTGMTTSLTFTLTNPAANTVALTGVGFTDTFPANLLVAAPNGLSGSCGGGTITAVSMTPSVTLAGATLPVGGTCTFSVKVIATDAGTAINSVKATSANGGSGNTASATLAINAPPQVVPVLQGWTLAMLGLLLAGAAWLVRRGGSHRI
jgi:uncharacterized repeat protein (TIGR01451 family)